MPVTFSESEWLRLTSRDKACLGKLASALDDFEPLAKFAGLGQLSVESLIEKGLAEEGPSSRSAVSDVGYRLTKKGWLANEWRTGNRVTEYPDT